MIMEQKNVKREMEVHLDVYVEACPNGDITVSCYDLDVDGEGATLTQAMDDFNAQLPAEYAHETFTFYTLCDTPDLHPLMIRAVGLSSEKHYGQTDKGGEPYMGHVARVAEHCETDTQRMVGLLHDLLEHTDVTKQQLLDEGFPEPVVEAVDAISRREGEDYEQYVRRLGPNALARRVKIAELIDNMDLLRLKMLNDDDCRRLMKYHQAWRYLLLLNRLSRQQ